MRDQEQNVIRRNVMVNVFAAPCTHTLTYSCNDASEAGRKRREVTRSIALSIIAKAERGERHYGLRCDCTGNCCVPAPVVCPVLRLLPCPLFSAVCVLAALSPTPLHHS